MENAELRIGTLFNRINKQHKFHLPESDVFKVIELRAFEIAYCHISEKPAQIKKWKTIPYADLSGIQLTEEWLLKFGFKCTSGEWYYPETEFGITFNEDHEPLHIWDASFTDAPIKYVHQLQNLYFALTGTELQCAL